LAENWTLAEKRHAGEDEAHDSLSFQVVPRHSIRPGSAWDDIGGRFILSDASLRSGASLGLL